MGAAGTFDVLVAEALDRLSRDQEHVAALFKHLSFAGVKIVTLAEGEIGALHVGLKGTMNALYLTDLRQKVWRGLEGRVRQRPFRRRPLLMATISFVNSMRAANPSAAGA